MTEVEDVSYLVARALGWRLSPLRYGKGVRVSGAGMDMAFHLVYSLAHVLHGTAADSNADSGYSLIKRSI